MSARKRSAPRPKAPAVELGRSKAKAASPEPPKVAVDVAPPPVEVTPPSRRFELEAEPVSLSDLQSVMLPGFEPPKWGGAPEPAAAPLSRMPSELPPAFRNGARRGDSELPHHAGSPRPQDSSAADLQMMQALVGGAIDDEPSSPGSIRSALIAPIYSPLPPAPEAGDGPVSADRIEVDSVDLIVSPAKVDTDPPPAAGRRPAYFDPPPEDEPLAWPPIFDAEPAPFDPTVPPLPPGSTGPTSDAPNSGLLDIRTLMGEPALSAAREDEERADADLFNLSGGLFGAGALQPPDMSALIAPAAPDSKRKVAPVIAAPELEARAPASKPKPAKPSKAAAKAETGLSAAPAPVVSERRTSAAATEAARRSARAGWAVAVAAIGGAILVLSLKLGSAPSSPAPVETAAPELRPAVPTATVHADAPRPTVDDGANRPKPEATSDEAALPVQIPGATTAAALARQVKDPAAAASGSPKAPAVSTAVAAAVTTAAVAPPPAVTTAAAPAATPTVVVMPPPPSGGGEFDLGAAKAALAAAAARAAGCKQPDDPSGGAKVSVTFAPSGRVTSSRVSGPPFQGTATGGCIASAFRSASVPPFEGSAVTVNKDVSIR
jgi:hypothetical protein